MRTIICMANPEPPIKVSETPPMVQMGPPIKVSETPSMGLMGALLNELATQFTIRTDQHRSKLETLSTILMAVQSKELVTQLMVLMELHARKSAIQHTVTKLPVVHLFQFNITIKDSIKIIS